MSVPSWAIRTDADRRAITEGCYWDNNKAQQITTFVNQFFHTQFSKSFKLTEPQEQILQSLNGWRMQDGRRRFRTANIHVPKKVFGKTMLCSALCLFEIYCSDEPSPFAVSGAASLQNAAQIYDEVAFSINHSKLKKFTNLKRHLKEITVKSLNSKYRSLASDGRRVHGFNCSLVVLDECHTMPVELWNSLRYATAARKNGLVVCISTAGDSLTHWYYSLYQKSKRILEGTDQDITHFAWVCEMDQDADIDPTNPEQWSKANPLLGQVDWANIDTFRRELEAAQGEGLGNWLNFQRLRLNRWCVADQLSFFDVLRFDEYKRDIPDSELVDYPCCLGVDLSETTDPTSISAVWDMGDKFHIKSWAWVAKKGAEERERGLLQSYRGFKNLIITDGDMIDERLILEHILKLAKDYNVKKVSFDPRSAYVLANRVSQDGITCQRIPCTARYYNPPMNELKKNLEQGNVTHNGSQWLKFCLQNVRIQVNKYDEVYPVRGKSKDKIDGAISTLLAMYGVLENRNDMPIRQGIITI